MAYQALPRAELPCALDCRRRLSAIAGQPTEDPPAASGRCIACGSTRLVRLLAAINGGLIMDELGGYRELAPPARMIGNAVFIGMLFLTTLLERLQLQLRATESAKWWASNGRDAVNAFAVASMA